jgi:sigma-B regulation protein RsbU (phosphoserine phosphatase)
MMAITHAVAHIHPDAPCPPGKFLARLNDQLVRHYTHGRGTFVTAFYGIYDAQAQTLNYARAGHNPPRLKRCADGTMFILDGTSGLPLGVSLDQQFDEAVQELQLGDQIIFYTDGITEAMNDTGELFGTQRLDLALENCSVDAAKLVREVLDAVEAFTGGRPPDDDRTMLVAKIT